jgi:DNA-binding CsgD family transcriptional regulator
MKPGHRAPITPEEREAMRQRRLEGKSLEEIAQEFSCSRVSAQKICTNLIERTFQTGKPISQEKIDQIVAFKKEGRTQSDIARMVGVTPHVVSKHTPPELKISRPRLKGGKPKRVRGLPQNLAGPPIRWSKEEIKILLDMINAGASFREIALKMKRSYVSVKDKVGRLSKIKPIEPEKEPEIKFEKKPKFVASKCLKCLKMFESYDPRKNRICARCKSNEGWSL